jgi:large subunit ribosomal protein L25
MVPIEIVGEAEGVKAGGQMDIMMHSIEVFCLPKDLPEKLVHDVTSVGQGKGVHVKDLILPEGVSIHIDGDVLILAITEPRVVETPAQAAVAAKK